MILNKDFGLNVSMADFYSINIHITTNYPSVDELLNDIENQKEYTQYIQQNIEKLYNYSDWLEASQKTIPSSLTQTE